MTDLKSLVLRTSGTNCELETARALDRAGAPAARSSPWEKPPAKTRIR